MDGTSADVFLPSPYAYYCCSQVSLGSCEFRCRSQRQGTLVYLPYVPHHPAHPPSLPTPISKFLQSPAVNLPCMASLSAPTSEIPSLVTAALKRTLRGMPMSSKLPVVFPTEPPKLPPNRFYVQVSNISGENRYRAAVSSTFAHSGTLSSSVRAHLSDGVHYARKQLPEPMRVHRYMEKSAYEGGYVSASDNTG